MDDRDLELLRTFRADEAVEPPGLAARVEEDLWQLVLAEEASRARRPAAGAGQRRWRGSLLRPLAAAGAAAVLAGVVAVASDGGSSGNANVVGGPAREASAGLLDGAASRLFGRDGGSTTATTGIPSGKIDVTEPDAGDAALVDGPALDDGSLDASSRDLVDELPRDPTTLLATVRAAATAVDGSDPADRAAFAAAMRWVVQPAVPTDLRAAMLRSVAGMAGLDAATTGVDVLGRTGLVVSHFDSLTGLREQWVLDPERGTLLERRAFTTTYADPTTCPPGTFTEHVVLDDDGHRVDPEAVPYLDWPEVLGACDTRPLP
ncbi:MAG: hypothetical protein JWM98_2377 [Thermoleophilia bacterium]|nr:hypothetical protein [Thermoleophilia bacterium]